MSKLEKKKEQLGMHPSTASNILVKDLLFNFIELNNITCHHCKEKMTRENFSIEHKIPWLDSENPKELYFDLKNIAFSHLSCNSGAARTPRKIKHPSANSYDKRGCRCDECKVIKRERNSKRYKD